MGPSRNEELLEALAQGVELLTESERWRAHLELQSRFHRYSFNNVLLIGAQDPDATRVAGFAAWKKMGRSVAKGERAIWIFAPMVGRRTSIDDGEEHQRIHGFRPVPVFDVAQTEGEELPVVCRNLEGGDPHAAFDLLRHRAESIGYVVTLAELPRGRNGDCNFARRLIRVESRNFPAQQVKTLAHEMAHALLHEGCADRALAELEAESTAYVVCRNLGVDSGDYSFGYVAVWAGGGREATAAIAGSGGAIQRAATVILGESEVADHGRPATEHPEPVRSTG